ncbi:MAG TPA: hypothetical protein VEX86_04140 [Longimicrobium sp.]|nr:hypothetical protein [Longimicrobium sp.]
MKRLASTWKSVLFAAAFVGSLGFGAVQAFAAPPAPAGEARACSQWACPECGSLGGVWVPRDGRCYCCG